jgi:hypothetical protein
MSGLQSPTPGIDIHSSQTYSPATTNPTSQTFTQTSHKGLPLSKLQRIQAISTRESEVIFFRKKERKERIPLSIPK